MPGHSQDSPSARDLLVADFLVRRALARGDVVAGRRCLLALTRLLHKAPRETRQWFFALKQQADAMREQQQRRAAMPSRRPRGRVRQGMVAPQPRRRSPRVVARATTRARSDCSRRSGARSTSTDSGDGPPPEPPADRTRGRLLSRLDICRLLPRGAAR